MYEADKIAFLLETDYLKVPIKDLQIVNNINQ
jgi:hypothetical protein